MQILAAGVVLSLLSSVGVASGQPLPPEDQRTVEWYASHPSERTQVRRICLNDPGHLAQSPDCINARRGDLSATLNSGRSSPGMDTGNPNSPGYWTKRPNDRATTLSYCGNMTPESAAKFYCGAAKQSLQTERRGGTGR